MLVPYKVTQGMRPLCKPSFGSAALLLQVKRDRSASLAEGDMQERPVGPEDVSQLAAVSPDVPLCLVQAQFPQPSWRRGSRLSNLARMVVGLF